MYKAGSYNDYDTNSADDNSTASLLRSVEEQEAQFEKLSKQMEMERQSVAKQLEKVKKSSDAASVSSVSDTDDSFVWRAHAGSEIDSDTESHNSSARILEERGVVSQGDGAMASSLTDNRSVTKTTTTRRVVQSHSYKSTNGIEEMPDLMITNSTPVKVQRTDSRTSQGSAQQNGPRMNDSFTSGDRPVRTPSNASSISYRSGRGEPMSSSYSTVVTSVTSDGALVTTYTTRTTTVQEEPTHVTKQYVVKTSDSVSSPRAIEDYDPDLQSRAYSSSRVTRHSSSTSSRTLPREAPRVELPKPTGPATLPRDYRPIGTSTPETYEEERVNPDGSVTKIKKIVSTTTHMMENDEPVVEVTISPLEMRESRQTTRTTTTRTTRTDRDTSETDYSLEREPTPVKSPTARSPNGYLIEETTTSTTRTGATGDRTDGDIVRTSSYDRQGSRTEDVMVRSSVSRGSSRSTGSKTPTERPPAYAFGTGASAAANASDGYVIEETITTDTTKKLESSAGDSMFLSGAEASGKAGAGIATATAVSVSYDEDEKKHKHEYEIDLLDLFMFLQTDDLALKANAAGYIQHLCYNDENIKIKIRELDIIPLLVRLLSHPDEDCHRNAAGALKNLSYGKYLDDNKAAIQECGGIPACVKLLYATNYLEVREYVTGILYNLSSAVQCRAELLDESIEAVSVLIVIPLSGWERSLYLDGRLPSPVLWSLLLRNSIGVLRNISAAGVEGRQKIRRQEGLIDALIWMLRAALASNNAGDINNKVVENIVCTLRNVSYKIDLEIDRESYADAIKIEDQVDSPSRVSDPTTSSPTVNGERRPGDAIGTGCLFMKKKPARLSRKNRKKAKEEKPAAPIERQRYVRPKRDYPPLGVELLWDTETVDLYIEVLKRSINPVTLEAAAGVIHNLVACQWNWAGLLRTHVRRQEGLRPIFELLSVDQEYVVRAVALALRNLALEERNKELTGKYAMQEMLAILPAPSSPAGETEPSEYTICAILGALQVVTHASYDNCKNLYDHDGLKKLIALTREEDPKREKQVRTYSQRVILDSNRVLMQMWHFKEFQEPIRKELWSHSKASDEEKAYKTATLKQPKKPKRDTFAEMEEGQTDIPLRRDSRRFVMIEDKDDEDEQASPLPQKQDIDQEERKRQGEEIEMKERQPAYVNGEDAKEDEPLVSGKSKKEKKEKNKKEKKEKSKDKKEKASKSDAEKEQLYAKPDKSKKSGSASKNEEEENDMEGETTPLYNNPVYKSKAEREEESVKLQDGTQADSWV